MANQYTILLSAKINEAGFQTYLTGLANKYTLILKGALSGAVAGATTSVTGSATAATTAATQATQKFTYTSQQAQTALRAQADAFRAAGNITREYTDNTNNLVRITSDFKNPAGEATTATVVWSQKTQELDTRLKTTGNEVKNTADRTKNWSDQIVNNTAKVIQWAIATAAIYGTLRKIQEGIQYISDLNVALTNISIVTGMTRDETFALGQTYNQLAKQMGVSTQAVAEGSLEWFRQGKTIEQASELMKSALMMSKLGNMEAAQATEYLTAILNGFKLQANDTIPILDKLVALDNNYATSVGELATAMQYSSAVANQSKVTFDQLAAYITVVSSVTRMSAETIGQSMKTMLTRMEQIKLGQMFEDDTTSINQVAEALHSVGIEMMLDANTFRPMGDVLNDLGKKWDTLTEKQQIIIKGLVAGIRQAPQFLTLMQNWGIVTDALGIELDSTGLSVERYGIYLGGVEAAANKFNAAWQEVWQTTISSESIKGWYNAGAAIADFINKLGGLIPIAKLVVAILIMYGGSQIAAAFAGFGAKIATIALALLGLGTTAMTTGAMITSALGLIGIVITGVILAINYFTETTTEKLQRLNQEIETYKTNLESLKSGADQLSSIGDEYETLRKKAEELGGVTKLSVEDHKRFLDLQNQIHAILPTVSGEYDDMGNYILTAGINIATLIGLMENQLAIQQAIWRQTIIEGTGTDIQKLKDLQTEQENYNIKLVEAQKIIDMKNKADEAYLKNPLVDMRLTKESTVYAPGVWEKYQNALKIQAEAIQKAAELAAQLEILRQRYWSVDEAQQSGLIALYNANDLTQEQIDLITALTPILAVIPPIIDNSGDSAVKTATALAELARAMNVVTAAQKEQSDAGYISAETAVNLISAHASLIYYLKQTADGFYLDAEGARSALYAEMQLLFAQNGLAIAAVQAAKGNYIYAASAIAASTATDAEKKSMMDLLSAFAAMGANVSVGGGISALETAQKKAIQDQIDALKKEKQAEMDSLKTKLENYKKVIDARKALLRSLKEEADYKDELADKEKSLSKIQNELIELSLDNSEEAKAKRLQLQEDLVKAQDDLDKTQRDRQYELEVAALDSQLAVYTDFINAQITAIQIFLDKTVEALQAALARIGATSGSGGISVPSTAVTTTLTGTNRDIYRQETLYGYGAKGGLVTGGISGKDSVLKALMPGEFILKKGAVDSLGLSLLNKLNLGREFPSFTSNTEGNNISVEMPITVMGNLDKSSIPDLERLTDRVVDKLNHALYSRGYKRGVNQYSN